jgi:hypothetical protein
VRTFVHRWQQLQQQSILQVTVLVFSHPLTSKCGSSSTDAFVTNIVLTFKSLCWTGCHNGNTPDSYSGGTQFESQRGHWLPSGPQGRFPIRPWPLPSESFLIHYSTVILSFDIIYFRYWEHHKISTNRTQWSIMSIYLWFFNDAVCSSSY